MSTYSGRYAHVKLGTNELVGIGNWSMDGVTLDQIDTTSFGSTWKTFEAGMSDGGQITFEGYYDITDTNGQAKLITANNEGTHLTSLRFYIDNTSFYIAATTNPASYIIITNYNLKHDKADIARISFTGKVSGKMVLTASPMESPSESPSASPSVSPSTSPS